MRNFTFIIFFSLVLVIYALINFYIFRRGWQALAGAGIYQTIFLYSFLFLVISFPLGRFAEQLMRNSFTDFLVIVGSFYLGLMVYALLSVIIIDVIRLADHFLHFFPQVITADLQKSARLTALTVISLSFLMVLGGHINALFPRIRTHDITIHKNANGLRELNTVVMSDVHLGTIIRSGYLNVIINIVNGLKPDLILLPGDIVDEDVAPVAEQNMSDILQKLESTYGIFAITGNHEYFSGVKAAVSYMEQGNITVLQDTAIKVADAFYLIGRKDLMAERMADGRKSLKSILQDVDKTYPLILMDHQPYHLDIARENGIDLQLSGHTHHGQLFPFNFITRLVYQLSWGYLKSGNTQYYVSCGVGTWGPPIRTNSVPEIVNLKIRFIPDGQ